MAKGFRRCCDTPRQNGQPHLPGCPEGEKLLRDYLSGVAIELDGERVDPKDFYLKPEEPEPGPNEIRNPWRKS